MEAEQTTWKYTETLQVMQGDCDVQGFLKSSALVRYAQQMATNHTAELGFDAAFYQENHIVFLLAKQAVAYERLARENERLTFVTMPEKSKRAANKRITLVYDERGDEIACVDSRWVLVDTQTRKIIRRPPAALDGNWGAEVARTVEMRAQKPEILCEAGTRTAYYSLCDINGHINNAYYMDLALDCVPAEILREKQLKRIYVNYHREVLLGETIVLQQGVTEEGVFVIGNKDGLPAFEAFCAFSG